MIFNFDGNVTPARFYLFSTRQKEKRKKKKDREGTVHYILCVQKYYRKNFIVFLFLLFLLSTHSLHVSIIRLNGFNECIHLMSLGANSSNNNHQLARKPA